jgi:conjugative transfer signal peptidase TraF
MKIRIFRKYPFLILAIISSSILIIKLIGLTINITPSMKEGFYVKTGGAIKRGDIVAACLIDPYKSIGLKNHYIEKGTKCDGVVPVIKRILAIPGDNVLLTSNNIIVNNIAFPFKTLSTDSSGRILNIYPRGKYFHLTGYWLIGTGSEKSWDSRYWGPVYANQILYKLTSISQKNF